MESWPSRFRNVLSVCALLAGLVPIAAPTDAAAEDPSCVIMLSMIDEVAISNLEFRVDYSDAVGRIEGSGASAVCRRALGGALAAFNDDDAAQTLKVAILRLQQFSGPVVLAGCRFFYDGSVPVASQFHVSIQVAARNGEDLNVEPLPEVRVTSVECPGELPNPTTTTTMTTTTVPVTSTTLVVDGRCGFPVSDGEKPLASDALYTLRAAVGLLSCPLCVCDVDGSTKVTASDALAVLRAAVGSGAPFACPTCS